MEVDRSETTTTAADVDQAQESALTSLSETLAQLEETPDNVPLLRRSINLMRTLNLEGELESIINRLSHLIMLEESESLVEEELIARPLGRVLCKAHLEGIDARIARGDPGNSRSSGTGLPMYVDLKGEMS